MIYLEYEKYKNKYYKAQERYNEILSEKETLFLKTQPKATKYNTEKHKGQNIFDNYLIEKEQKQIDKKLKEVRSILKDREKLLNMKEEELKKSPLSIDKVYKYKYIDNLSIEKISRLINYSRTQTYRIKKVIDKTIGRNYEE